MVIKLQGNRGVTNAWLSRHVGDTDDVVHQPSILFAG
jgi:hypothetical protein